MSEEGEDSAEILDIGSLFRGTAIVAFVVEIVTAIMMLGSGAAYVISRSGLIESIDMDIAILLFLGGSMIALFLFLGAIGFFVRFSRKIGNAVIGAGIGSVDLKAPRVKSVVIIYGLAIGLILFMGMYGYWLIYKNFFAPIAETSLSFLGVALSLGAFILAFLIQIVVAALGRTATTVIHKVLLDKD